ncbi:hypothetical protein KAR91_42015 [Candidatus Pacearchaeota archaeon]|nr:hypothetical protein [Candidatus Pacearchaeota archaeon]
MGAGLMAAGAGVGALSSIQQGKQANAIAQYNAAVGEQEAIASEEKAAFDEAIHRDRTKKAISTIRARMGRSGVTSPAQAQAIEASIEAGELDALAIRHSGAIEAARARSGAKLERMRGRAAKRAGKIGAVTSLLSGGSKLIPK